MSLSAVSSSIANATAQTIGLANSLQQSQNVIALLEQGQQTLQAAIAQSLPPTLDGTGQAVDRQA